MSVPRRLRPLFLFGLALAVFLPMVGARDVVTSHEARVAQTARQMAAVGWPWEGGTTPVPVVAVREVDGMKTLAPVPGGETFEVNPWLVPVMSGMVRLQKPPLPYWCSAVMFNLFGFGEGAARLPAALLGAVGVLLVYDLGRLLMGRAGGWCAGLVYVSSYFVFDEYRKAMANPYLAFFSLLSVWAWVRSARGGEGAWGGGEVGKWGGADGIAVLDAGSRTQSGTTRHRPTPPPPYLSTPQVPRRPIPLHPHLLLLPRARRTRQGPDQLPPRRRRPLRLPRLLPSPAARFVAGHLLGVAVCLAVALPWPVYILTHVRDINHGPWLARLELWRYESVGEFADNTEKARGWWFYLPGVFQIALPWTPAWVLGAAVGVVRLVRWRRGRGRPDRRAWFPLLWFAVTLVIFSASHVKKNAYLLPVMPAMALTAGRGLVWLTAGRDSAARAGRPRRWSWRWCSSASGSGCWCRRWPRRR